MVIIRIDRKLVKAVFVILIVVSIGVNMYNHMQNIKLKSTTAHMASYFQKDVEIFDISKGEVKKRILVNPVIKNEVEEYLKSITGMYGKVNAIPVKGYIIKVPLEPPIEVQSKWLNGYGINTLEDVFVILPEQGRVYLLVLDSKYRPYCYNFDCSIEELLSLLNLQPEFITH